MNPPKKFLLGIALLLAAALIFQIQNQKKTTQAKIEAFEDYFKVSFDIAQKDQDKAQKTLELLNLPSHILRGFDFELDSTSSARLAFASPVVIDFTRQDKKLEFRGRINSPTTSDLPVNSNLKIPKNTKVGIFSRDFKRFAQKFLQDQDLTDWYNQNFSASGQYLITFGDQDQFTVIAQKSEPVSFADLQTLSTSDQDQAYKQESFELDSGKTIDLHILKSSSTFFQLGESLYFASSPKAAKDFLNAQVGNVPSISFWDTKVQDVSLAAFWQKQESSSAEDLDLILGSGHNISKYLQNIERFTAIQKDGKFEGSVRFKSD